MNYKFADKSVTHMSVGYYSFGINKSSGNIKGLNPEEHGWLIDKWLKSGIIVEVKEKVESKVFEDKEEIEEELSLDE